MPEYLKRSEDSNTTASYCGVMEPKAHKVKKQWAMNLSGDFRDSNYSCFVSEWLDRSYSYSSFYPVTKEEYEAQTNNKN